MTDHRSHEEILRSLMLNIVMANKEPKEESDVWSDGFKSYVQKDGQAVIIEDRTPPKCPECGYIVHFGYNYCPDCGEPV